MLRKSSVRSVLTLVVGTWLAGCAPVPAPPAPPGMRPGIAPGWNSITGALTCLTPMLIGLVTILIIIALFSVWKGKQPILQSSPSPITPPAAREIIQARYARGEIDRQQYQQMLQDIGAPRRDQTSGKEGT